ncbi:hypothetical protein ACFW6V_04735 [Streptomyces sp. NPDC058734]|uniref:hypothetical protein n=1 Tax=Streptomyces sp. NPDC058734 TaxID=3346615 RepID=UPI0036B4F2EF
MCLVESWLVGHLAAIDDSERIQIVRRFATWDVLPKLRARAGHRPLTPGSRKCAADQIRHATAFLSWLDDHDRDLATCRQADLINDLGVPTTAGQAAAIRRHVLEMPAPVVADALGYHHVTTTKLVGEPGGTRRNLEPIRPRRPHTVTQGLGSSGHWRQLNTRAHQ